MYVFLEMMIEDRAAGDCPFCGGSGECPICLGTGTYLAMPCVECRGTGRCKHCQELIPTIKEKPRARVKPAIQRRDRHDPIQVTALPESMQHKTLAKNQEGCEYRDVCPNDEEHAQFIEAVCNTEKHRNCLTYDTLRIHFTKFFKAEDLRKEYAHAKDRILSQTDSELPLMVECQNIEGEILPEQTDEKIIELTAAHPVLGEIRLKFNFSLMDTPVTIINKTQDEIFQIYQSIVPNERKRCICGQLVHFDFAIFCHLTGYPRFCCTCLQAYKRNPPERKLCKHAHPQYDPETRRYFDP